MPVGSTASAKRARRLAEDSAPLYSCDQLTPQLCDLRVTNGTLTIRGLSLRYWEYDAPALTPGSESALLPIIMVHGGPGWSHHYMLPLKQQACRGRKVIFYDQVGAGLSQKPTSAKDSAPWLLTIPYYLEELQFVADALLGGSQPFHLLGSSWGTVVAQEYALQTPPPAQLASLVLSGPLSDGQFYIESQWDPIEGGLGTLPLFTQQRIHHLERTPKGFETQEYALLNERLESAFTVRTYPAPECFQTAASLMNEEIYVGMQGESEFTIGGVLEFWSVTAELHRVRTPTLLTHGSFDTMRPPVLRAMHAALPHAKVVLMPRSGHCSMIDDPGLMNDEIAAFLDCVESGASAVACTAGGELGDPSALRMASPHALSPTLGLVLLLAGLVLLAPLATSSFRCRSTRSKRTQREATRNGAMTMT